MPNNFVFDMIAEDLKSLIYGLYNNDTAIALAVDSAGNLILQSSYTSDNTTIASIATTATGTALQENTSDKSLYSFYVKNNSSTASVSVKLQVSPTSTSSYFIDDSSTAITLATGAATVLVPKVYQAYTQLYYTNLDETDTAAIVAYYDGRG